MRKKLGEMLLELGVIDEPRLHAALSQQQRFGGRIGRILVDMKVVTEKAMLAVLSKQLNLPVLDPNEQQIGSETLELVPGAFAEEKGVMPVAVHGKFLDVSMSDPSDIDVINHIQAHTKLNVRPHLAGPRMIEQAIARFYHRGIAATQAQRPASGDRAVAAIATPRDQDLDLGDSGASLESLRQEVEHIKALLQRDEDVLRNLLYALISKGVISREDLQSKG
jgi:type IV pilus assembly protein PilB